MAPKGYPFPIPFAKVTIKNTKYIVYRTYMESVYQCPGQPHGFQNPSSVNQSCQTHSAPNRERQKSYFSYFLMAKLYT